MNVASFVGEGRRNLVADLEAVWSEIVAGGGPRFIVLSAPIGWGKTRLIHEFYSRLAAGQPSPHYWPPAFDLDPVEPLRSRKLTHPSEITVNPRATITYLWWGLSCNRRADGRRAQVLVDDSTQVYAHSLSIEALTNSRLRQALESGDLDSSEGIYQKGSLVLDVISCFGVAFPAIAVGRAFLDVARTAVDIANRYRHVSVRSEAILGTRKIDAEDVERQRFVDDLSATVSRLSQQRVPLLLFLDDAHDADESVMAFVSSLLKIPENRILIIACTWPDQLANPMTEISDWIRSLQEDVYGVTEIVQLDQLSGDDLATIVREVAPHTSPTIVSAFVNRFSPNPFLLRQALSFRSVKKSMVDGAITMSPQEIDQLESDLDGQYLRKWGELPTSVREVLMVASELGPTYVEDCSANAAIALMIDSAVEALSQSAEIYGWAISLDSWVDSFIERDLHELARDQWRRQFRAADSDVVRVAVRSYMMQQMSSGVWMRLSLLAQRTILEFVCKNSNAVDDLDLFASLELSKIYEAEGRYGDARAVLEKLLSQTNSSDVEKLSDVFLKFAELALILNLPREAANYALMLQDARSGLVRQSATLLRARAEADIGNYTGALSLLKSLEVAEKQALLFERIALEVRLIAEVGCFDEAYEKATELAAELEKAVHYPSPEHLRAMNLLGWAASRSDRTAEALKVAEQAISIYEELLGDAHPEILEASNNLARFLFRAGNHSRAVAVGRDVLERRERLLGPRHQKTLTSMDNLAMYLLSQKEASLALELSNRAIAGWQETFGSMHPKALTARVHHLEILLYLDRILEASDLVGELVQSHIAVLGAQHPNTLKAVEICAKCVLTAQRADLVNIFEDFVGVVSRLGVANDSLGSSTLILARKNNDR